MYGEQDVFPATEEHPRRPASPYGTSKLCGEEYVEHYRRNHGLSTLALRYANVYGPGQDPLGRQPLDDVVGRALAVERLRLAARPRRGHGHFFFHARDLHLVLGPAPDGKPVRFRVRIDGAEPGPSHGVDTDASGNGVVREQRLYQLIRQSPGEIHPHTFTIEFLDGGVQAYAFTFG